MTPWKSDDPVTTQPTPMVGRVVGGGTAVVTTNTNSSSSSGGPGTQQVRQARSEAEWEGRHSHKPPSNHTHRRSEHIRTHVDTQVSEAGSGAECVKSKETRERAGVPCR
ncbi:hypothetical protein Pmani_005584 [Petrolisthes manimaculis]|uniref:Uncharacterized protein n=1 Tax=Petrolisthes manimaculis TaxID=1843537 RepID=A0AAE1QC53_9EUCA|nr:hypothetical protein Pmani_005584 [Petrolisthes manimaculis]